jgi:hypothetical protein
MKVLLCAFLVCWLATCAFSDDSKVDSKDYGTVEGYGSSHGDYYADANYHGRDGKRGHKGDTGPAGPAGPRGPAGFLQNGLYDCNSLANVPVRATLGPNPVDNRGAYATVDGSGAGVFYTFIPDETGDYKVDTCNQLQGGDQDSVISVYELPAPPLTSASAYTDVCSALDDPIADNDDGCDAASPGGLESSVTFSATAGTTYIIAISECCAVIEGFKGTFTVSLVGAPRTGSKPRVPTKEKEKKAARQSKKANKSKA